MKCLEFIIFHLIILVLFSCNKIDDRLEEEKEKLLKETDKLKVKIDSGLKKVDSLKKDIDSLTQRIFADSIKTSDTTFKK